MDDGSRPDQQPGTTPAQSPPPPGWQPPPAPAPGYPAPPYAAPGQGPYGAPPPSYGAPAYAPPGYAPLHQARPVYKPGTIPLRPLGVSDMFSGAIETIRRNPKATIGVAALVLTGFLILPVVGTLIWGSVAGFGSDLISSTDYDGTTPEDVGLFVSLAVGGFLSFVATTLLTGMIVHVVEHAARGQKLAAGDAWRLTRSRAWRLIGLALLPFVMTIAVTLVVVLLVVLAALASGAAGITVGIFAGIGGFLLVIFLYIRMFQLAAAGLVLERIGVFVAIRRAWALSRGQFWRVFGITLLTLLVTSVAAQFVTIPAGIVGGIGTVVWQDTVAGVVVYMLAQNVGQLLGGALTTPFSASMAALQYLDQRIRKEGYDIALISQLPGLPPAGPVPVPYPGPGPAPYAPPPPPPPAG